MKKSTVIVPKPSSYNFDNTTMYNLQEKLEIDLITEKFNRSLRPIPTNPKAIPVYVPPYYTPKETGFSNMNHDNIFRRGT